MAPPDEKGRMWRGGSRKARVPENSKICVIDDDESVREALRSLLKSVEFEAEVFASAEDFLGSDHLPGTSCLILDVRMPGMSGFELHEQLIADEEEVPIIFISAHADEEARARALRSGAVDFLLKPFSDEALLHAIETAMLLKLRGLLASHGQEAVIARSGQEALDHLDGVDAVITDFAMPGMDGVQLVRAIHERDDSLPVIVLTAHGSERVAVQAMKGGAYDYVTKPFDGEEFLLVVSRALEARTLRVQNRRLTAEKALGQSIVGDGPAMRRLLETVSRVAPKDITVLVRGETGTGKELIASLIHAQSQR